MEITSKLHAAIAAVCPIDGVSIGRRDDKATWRIDFKDTATTTERTSAQVALAAFDVAASDAEDQARKDRATTLEQQSRTDVLITRLRTATPAEIQNFVQTNVTDLASARAMMIRLAIAVAYLLRGES